MRECHILLAEPFTPCDFFSKNLIEVFNLEVIDTSKLFRFEIQTKSVMGKEALSYIEKGKLVPNKLTIELFKKQIASTNVNFLIEGFPKTNEQYDLLKNYFIDSKISINRIWYLKLNNVNYSVEKMYNESINYNKKHGITKDSIKDKIVKYIDNIDTIVKHMKMNSKLITIEIDREKKV
ncbi:nucleoside monophosphate kinase [Aquimarina muelleri]|uniref:nucleoside monophosphate kinase n=1 Tax=Aquimarina muelleri TaxID=279356 RepID=UPI003F6861B0